MSIDLKQELKSKQNQNVSEYINKVLRLIEKEEINEAEAAWITKETVDGFREHVNPGFLEYRKTVTEGGQFAAVNGRIMDPALKMLMERNTLIVLAVLVFIM